MKVLANIYDSIDANQRPMLSFEMNTIPISSNLINLDINGKPLAFVVCRTLFIDKYSCNESFDFLQILKEHLNPIQYLFLEGTVKFSEIQSQDVWLKNMGGKASIFSYPLKDVDSIKIEDSCYNCMEVILDKGNETIIGTRDIPTPFASFRTFP